MTALRYSSALAGARKPRGPCVELVYLEDVEALGARTLAYDGSTNQLRPRDSRWSG